MGNMSKETDQKYNEYKENAMNKKKGFTRHRVLLLGDSHMRGCADELKRNLKGDFMVSGIVKMGGKTKDILGTRIDQDMSKNDIVVVWAGANDIGKNNANEGIKNIVNSVKGSRRTNIIIMEALHRHDLIDWSCVNEEIGQFNRLLAKRLKLYKQVATGKLQLDRQHFTLQGMHMNYEGKIRTCQRIAKLVQRKLRLEDRASTHNIIRLKYKEDMVQEVAAPLENPQLEGKKDIIYEEAIGTQGNKTKKKRQQTQLVWYHLKEISNKKFEYQPDKGSPQ
jgi:hypothetical protein